MANPWGIAISVAIVLGAWLGPLAIPAMALWFAVVHGLRGRIDIAFALAIAGSLGLGILRGMAVDDATAPADLPLSSGAVLEIESFPRPSPGGESVLATVRQLSIDDAIVEVTPFRVRVRLPEDVQSVPGDVVTVSWSAETLASLPPGYAGYVTSVGASASARIYWLEVEQEGFAFYRALVSLRRQITTGLQSVLSGDAGALAAGIVTGDDSGLSEAARESFLRTGTTHITAVSGSNVAMVLALWNLLIPSGRARRLAVIQAGIVISIWLYALLVGLEPPAVRAAMVASLGLFAGRAGRRPDLITLLAVTAAAMVLWNPRYVEMVSFWLSIVASVAISVRIPATGAVGPSTAVRGIVEGVLLAQLATLPLVVGWFGSWSLTSIVANAILSPLMWLAFPLCFVLAVVVLVIPPVAPVLAVVPLVPLTASLQVVEGLGSMVPPLDLDNTGRAGVLAVTLPCAVLVAVLARDVQRWRPFVAHRWHEAPLAVGVTLIAPLAGVLVGLLSHLVVG